MVIEKIMKTIWSDITDSFAEQLKRCSAKSPEVLYDEARYLVKQLDRGISNDTFHENIVATSGCSHRNHNGVFAGCSMCNWESADINLHVVLYLLRKKDPILYAKIIRKSFENERGSNVKPAIIEEIATHNVMDSFDFPEEVFNELFDQKPIYAKRPVYGLIAARAADVELNKLLQWKHQFRQTLIVGIGVEVGHEFLRNHWVNKNSTNAEIEKAIKLISEANCLATADILLGVPGLSPAHSIDELIYTCKWLNTTSVDTILVSPLTRKERTLQHLIYEKLQQNSELIQRGIVDGEFTSVPSLIMVFETLHRTFKEIPEIEAKMKLSPQNGTQYLSYLDKYFDTHSKTQMDEYLYNEFKNMIHYNMTSSGISKEKVELIIKRLKSEKGYQEFLDNLKMQQKYSVQDNLMIVNREIVCLLWKSNWECYDSEFHKEINECWDEDAI